MAKVKDVHGCVLSSYVIICVIVAAYIMKRFMRESRDLYLEGDHMNGNTCNNGTHAKSMKAGGEFISETIVMEHRHDQNGRRSEAEAS